MRATFRWILTGLVLVNIASAAWAQQGGVRPQEPFVTTSVRNVVLDVVVTDKAGHPVTDLKREHFTVAEDGVPQLIRYFAPAVPNLASSVPSSGTHGDAGGGRAIILLDAINNKFEDFAYSVSSLRKMLARNPALPQPTTLLLLTDHGVKKIADTTGDSNKLMEGIEKHGKDMVISLPASNMRYEDLANLSLGALQQLAEANLDSGHNQSILWITPGINTSTLERTATGSLSRLVNALSPLSDELLRSRTVVNAVDPQGVGQGFSAPIGVATPVRRSDAQNASQDAYSSTLVALAAASAGGFNDLTLSALTSGTGGMYIYNRNDADVQMLNVLTSDASSYALAYAPTNSDFNGKFRAIRITVKRPNVEVHTRPGYFAVAGPVSADIAQVKYALDHAVTSDIGYAGIACTLHLRGATPEAQPIEIIVDPLTVRWQPQQDAGYKGRVELLVVSFDAKNKALVSVRRTMTATISAVGFEAAMKKPWKIEMEMPAESSTTLVRVVAADLNSDRIGSAEAAVPLLKSRDPNLYK